MAWRCTPQYIQDQVIPDPTENQITQIEYITPEVVLEKFEALLCKYCYVVKVVDGQLAVLLEGQPHLCHQNLIIVETFDSRVASSQQGTESYLPIQPPY